VDGDDPTTGPDGNPPEPIPTPFSFKVVVVLGGLYLLWRAIQLVACIPSLLRGADCPWF
jgi:hypothetical protein